MSAAENILSKVGVPGAVRLDRAPRTAARLLRLERRTGPESVAVVELAALPAALWASMPVSFTAWIAVPGRTELVGIAASYERASKERESGALVLDPEEWNAIVTATESDRLWPADFRAAIERRARTPETRLDGIDLLAGARGDSPREWSVGRVLARLGVRLAAVTF